MNLEKTLQKIRYLMSLFVTEIKAATAMQQTDINKVSENVVIPLFAEVYDYKNLKNLNFTEASNFPGIDLADETARVAFQITSTPTLDKVKHTLEKFIEYKLYEKYDRLIIYILTEKQNSYSEKEINKIIQGKFTFDTKKDIWDSRNILEKVSGLQIEQAREVEKILEVNFGEARRQPEWEVIDKIENIINEYTQLFVGRSKETQELDNFLHENSSGAMLVTAEAGFGKTALLANWLQSRQNNGCFIAYHFFSQRHEKTRSAKSAYKNLLRQLHIYYELYHEPQPDELDELRAAIYNILRERGARQDKLLIIVVDALGELNEVEIPFSLPFPTPLPNNVFVIASARASEAEEPKYLENWIEQSQKLHLKCLPKVAFTDWLKRTGEGELALFADDINFVTKLDEITQGFPLYLNYLIDELSHAAKQQQDVYSVLAETPQGFEKYVKQQLNRLDELELPDERWQFFALLAVAKGVLEKDDIKVITQMRDRQLRKLHQCWQVTRWMKIIEGKYYAFAHPLLGTVFAKELGDDADDALEKLIDYCSDWHKHQSCYALRHYPQHLRDAKLWDDLYGLARNRDFLEVQSEQLLDEPDLPLKTMQLALACAAEEDNAGLMAEFMLLHARWIEDTKVKESPLDALRKGSLERALKLVEIYEVERQILWYLLLVWELKDTDKLDEAQKIIEKLQQEPLFHLSNWKGNYAVNLLVPVLEIDKYAFKFLVRQLLNDYFCGRLCIILIQKGELSTASEIGNEITTESEYLKIFEKIGIAQAESGNFKGAIETAYNIDNQLQISEALLILSMIVETKVKQQEFTSALKTIELISNNCHKNDALNAIAVAQTKLGEVEAALEIVQIAEEQSAQSRILKNIIETLADNKVFNRAQTLIHQIKDDSERCYSFAAIATKQAREGLLSQAFRSTIQIENVSLKVSTLIVIATKQFKFNHKEDALNTFMTAINSVKEIKQGTREQSRILFKIAISQAQLGKLKLSLETTRKIIDKYWKNSAFKEISSIQARNKHFQSAFEIIQLIEDERDFNQAIESIAEIQADSGKLDIALQTVNQINDKWKQAWVLRNIAVSQAENKNFKAAFTIVYKIDREWELQRSALNEIAVFQLQNSYTDAAKNTFAYALNIQDNIDLNWEKGKSIESIAKLQALAGKNKSAKINLNIALEIADKINDKFNKSRFLGTLASIYKLIDDNETAKELFKISQNIAWEIEDELEKIRALWGIVVSLVEAKENEDANLILENIINSSWKIESEFVKAKMIATIAAINAQLGNFDDALKIARKIHKDEKAWLLVRIAVCQAQAGQFEPAFETLQEINSSQEQKSELHRAWAFKEIAFVQLEGKQTEVAQNTFKKAIELAQAINIDDLMAVILATAGFGRLALKKIDKFPFYLNENFPEIALAMCKRGDIDNFKELLIPCAYYLDASYRMCGYLPRLYPQNAQAVAEVVKNLD